MVLFHCIVRHGTVRFTFGGFSTGYCTWYFLVPPPFFFSVFKVCSLMVGSRCKRRNKFCFVYSRLAVMRYGQERCALEHVFTTVNSNQKQCFLAMTTALKPNENKLMRTLCFHLLTSFMVMPISFSSRTLAPAHSAKTTSKWFTDHDITVLDWPANMPDLNSIWNLWDIFKRKMRNRRSNNTDELMAQ